MEGIYIQKKEHFEGRFALLEKSEILSAINQNTIKNYFKIPNVKRGTIVTCCKIEDSLLPNGYSSGGAGYTDNLTFRVTSMYKDLACVIAFGGDGSHGVFLDHLRLATKEEVLRFEEDVKSGKIPDYNEGEDDDDDNDIDEWI